LIQISTTSFHGGKDELWKIGSKNFYDNLIDSMEKVIAGNKTEKIQLYFSHDYSVSIIMNGLGEKFGQKPPFATSLFFELHQDKDKFYVKTLYNDQPTTFGDCKDELCEFTTFKNYLKSIHPTEPVSELCKVKSEESAPFIDPVPKPYPIPPAPYPDFEDDDSDISKDESELQTIFDFFEDNNILFYIVLAIVFVAIGYAIAKYNIYK
jgi:hypothetical protein